MILFLIFLCFTICLLFYVIKSPGSWLPKFFLIFFSLYLSASVIFSVDNFKGWPYNAGYECCGHRSWRRAPDNLRNIYSGLADLIYHLNLLMPV